jgi:hypothetical protein
MIDTVPNSKSGCLAGLIKRRSRRGWWIYVIWLLSYVLSVMLYLGDTGADLAQVWPLFIPIPILVLQWVRPTVLVWVAISLPTFLYFGIVAFYEIIDITGPRPHGQSQWDSDSQGVILGWIFFAAWLVVCIALMFAPRPGAFRETRAD